jgi:hypothetical protein
MAMVTNKEDIRASALYVVQQVRQDPLVPNGVVNAGVVVLGQIQLANDQVCGGDDEEEIQLIVKAIHQDALFVKVSTTGQLIVLMPCIFRKRLTKMWNRIVIIMSLYFKPVWLLRNA